MSSQQLCDSSYCGIQLTVVDLTQVAAAAVCVVLAPATHAATHTLRPSGLLTVHTVLTLAGTSVDLCGMTRI